MCINISVPIPIPLNCLQFFDTQTVGNGRAVISGFVMLGTGQFGGCGTVGATATFVVIVAVGALRAVHYFCRCVRHIAVRNIRTVGYLISIAFLNCNSR